MAAKLELGFASCNHSITLFEIQYFSHATTENIQQITKDNLMYTVCSLYTVAPSHTQLPAVFLLSLIKEPIFSDLLVCIVVKCQELIASEVFPKILKDLA